MFVFQTRPFKKSIAPRPGLVNASERRLVESSSWIWSKSSRVVCIYMFTFTDPNRGQVLQTLVDSLSKAQAWKLQGTTFHG